MNKGKIVLRNGIHKIHVEAYECPLCNRLVLIADLDSPYCCEECAAAGHTVDMKSIAWVDVPGVVWSNRHKYSWAVTDGLFCDKKSIVYRLLDEENV